MGLGLKGTKAMAELRGEIEWRNRRTESTDGIKKGWG